MRTNILWAKISLTLLIVLSVSFIYADCKLLGLIGLNGNKLSALGSSNTWSNFTSPCLDKLQSMGRSGITTPYPNNNPDGWGIVAYGNETPTVTFENRNNPGQCAFQNGGYDDAEFQLQYLANPRIVLGHVRKASVEATAGITDPHPFRFILNSREYSFIHNGGVNWQTVRDLIGNAWLDAHPEYPIVYYGNTPVDTQLYFYWIMKNIEEQNGDVLKGLKIAIQALTYNSSHSCLNFILTDGTDLYSYRYIFSDDGQHELAYFYDTENVKNNYFYSGVMSIFPNEWLIGNEYSDTPNNIQTHKIDNDELVYISSTGNIVRLPNFGSNTIATDKYCQKRDYHEGYNWVGLPILPVNTQTQSVAVSPLLNYFLQPANGGIQSIENLDNGTVLAEFQNWQDLDYPLYMTKLFKMQFDSNSPSIHTTTFPVNQNAFIFDAFLYPRDANILNNIVAYQDYWISYTPLPTQNIKDAFGTSWVNVASVKAENWFYAPMPHIQTKDYVPPEAEPLYTWTTIGKNMEFGKGYIVSFKTDQTSFAWNCSDLRSLPDPERQKPEFFTWKDAPDYLVVDIAQADDQPDILEVGAFQGENCIGAVKPEKIPCQLLIYPKFADETPVTFQIIYKEKGTPQQCSNYLVYNEELQGYYYDQVIPQLEGYYRVKLTTNTPSQCVTSINPLLSVSSYPNPFKPSTAIAFALNQKSNVHVSIYNVKGQMVKDFGTQVYDSGIHNLHWNGSNNSNTTAAEGIYFVRVDAGKNMLTHKMIMLK